MRVKHTTGDTTVRAVISRLVPHLHVLAQSKPVPGLRRRNILFFTRHREAAQDAIVTLEEMHFDDDRLGAVVLGRGQSGPGVDAEGVRRHLAPRIVIGALLGAVVGAIVIGGGAVLFGASRGIALGGAGAGALVAGLFGAMWAAFSGPAGTEAGPQTFVDDSPAELAVVSAHTDVESDADAAKGYLTGQDGTVVMVDEFGDDVSPR